MKAKPLSPWQVTIIAFATIVVVSGCEMSRQATNDDEENEKLTAKMGELYNDYLLGDINARRRDVLEIIRILENAKFLKEEDYAYGLWLGYARLVVIETRVGNNDLVAAYIMESQYWRLKQLEASGDRTEDALKTAKSFTVQKCVEMIDQLDESNIKEKHLNRRVRD